MKTIYAIWSETILDQKRNLCYANDLWEWLKSYQSENLGWLPTINRYVLICSFSYLSNEIIISKIHSIFQSNSSSTGKSALLSSGS